MTGRLAALALAATATLLAHDVTSDITWSREISRLFARHCASCHIEGGAAFPLSTWQQAKPRAAAIAKSVTSRTMPPFGAVKGFGQLRDDESLTQEQIELVTGWVRAGAPEGDPSLLAKSPAKPLAAAAPPLPSGADFPVTGSKTLDRAMTFTGLRATSLPPDASVRIIAQTPRGKVEPLIWLYRYNPKYPRTWTFREPLRLPAGTKIVASLPGASIALIAAP